MLYLRTALGAITVLWVLFCPISSAQVASAQLEGFVRDPSGAVVTGAEVSIINANTRAQAKTSSTTEGRFIFPSLKPGRYTLSTEAMGFCKTVVSDLELNVGETVVQDIKLEIGAMTERIVVRADEERVQVADAELTRGVTLRDIEVLPQLAREPLVLAVFGPGVQINASDPSVSHVNGTRRGSTNTRVDGIDANDSPTPRLGLSNTSNNGDSIEEFRIVTAGGKAEYGRNAGGQIELITRSGTNTWHGNTFEYHRNAAFNANSFFGNSSGLPRPAYIQNTFGASLGGPIRHKRTFIFGNYQGRRNSQQVVRNRLVLTPEAKAGLFRWRPPGSPEIRTFDIVRNDPRNMGIDPEVADILKLLPDPNNYDIGDGLNTAGYRFNNPSISFIGDIPEDQFTVRADHIVWSGHRLFFRGTWGRSSFVDVPCNNDARYPGQPPATQSGHNWGYSIGSDWSIKPYMINELRIGYKFYTWDFRRPARLQGPMLISNSWADPLNPAFSSSRKPPVRQITDNFTIVHGKHILKGGIEGRFTTEWRSNDYGIWPDVRFGTSYGNAPPSDIGPQGIYISSADRQSFEKLYNDLLGRMNLVTRTFYSDLRNFQPAGSPRVRTHRFREFSCFFQDDWKIHPRLTLNLGLRYEFFGVPYEVHGFQGVVDKAAQIHATARLNDLTVQPDNRWYNNDLNNFAPRIGLAWDPTGKSKMAFRVNWGIFYDRLIGATTNSVDANTPGFALRNVPVYPNLAGVDHRISDGIPLPQHPATPELRPPATRSTDLFLFSPNLRTGYALHYGITLQREIFRNTAIEAGYVGTRGIKLFMDLNLNQPRIYEDFLTAFKELQSFRMHGTPVSAFNTLVRIFSGSPNTAISAIGAGAVDRGEVGAAADTIDRLKYPLYAQAGISEFYLRNFPQFNQVVVGTNDGRSYYNSFQLTLHRQAGALRFVANYTYSKSMDNISVDGKGFTGPIDNFNVRLNLARSDFDIPHAFNMSLVYTLPVGRNRRFAAGAPGWANLLIGGWDIGLLTILQSGPVITYLSGRATGPTTDSSYADYIGDRNIGRVMHKDDGIYWLTAEEINRFSFPDAGEVGTGGRNAFRGPRFFNVDVALTKQFRINEKHAISFRAEAYNLFNNVNFDVPNADMSKADTFGKISSTVSTARIMQMALRYDF